MFKKVQPLTFKYLRYYTSKAKRSLLLQDTEKFQVHEYPTSNTKKLRIYAWGLSETGALGIQTSTKKHAERQTAIVHHPTRLQFAENTDITDVAAGYGFTAFAVSRSDGEILFGTGINTDSQLGLQQKRVGSNMKPLDLVIYPTAIKLPRNEGDTDEDMQIKCLSAGRAHLVVVNKKGSIFTLGNNAYGQCGRQIIENELYKGSNTVHRIDNLVGADDEIISVECGQDHTIFLTKSGKLYSCGWGADGQTGLGHYNSTGEISLIRGDVENEKIVKVASTGDCVLAINDKGDVFGWGNAEYGQLFSEENSPTQINTPRVLTVTKGLGRIVDVASGGAICIALNDQGDAFSWGYGILGFGPDVEQTSHPKQLLPQLFGRNDFSPNSRVVSVHSGIFHMGAINSEGDLFMWGRNRYGCLGLGHRKDQYFPFKAAVNAKVLKVSCGVDHTMALCRPFI